MNLTEEQNKMKGVSPPMPLAPTAGTGITISGSEIGVTPDTFDAYGAAAAITTQSLGLGTADSPTFAGLTVNGAATANHFVGGGSTPTVAAGPGSGATTPATISISGTDASMQVSFTTNQGGISAGVMFTVTFATPFAVAPIPTFSPGSPATANDLVIHEFWVSATTTTLTMTAGAGTFGNGIAVTLNIKT